MTHLLMVKDRVLEELVSDGLSGGLQFNSSIDPADERDRKRKNEATFREKESYARNELSQVLQERMQDDGEVWEEGLSFRKCLWFSAEQMR